MSEKSFLKPSISPWNQMLRMASLTKKMNIIDSKSDLGFKKVFAERPHLLMSLLNNLLPLSNPIKYQMKKIKYF
jgi:hypothetical protein